jgi:hypothetical protein
MVLVASIPDFLRRDIAGLLCNLIQLFTKNAKKISKEMLGTVSRKGAVETLGRHLLKLVSADI